jgi:hypothetical protein
LEDKNDTPIANAKSLPVTARQLPNITYTDVGVASHDVANAARYSAFSSCDLSQIRLGLAAPLNVATHKPISRIA